MCTIFAKKEEQGLIIGRNFDWVQFGGNIYFQPPYRSYGSMTLGICYIEQLGKDKPYEGINEKGLLGGIMALPTKANDESERSPIRMSAQGLLKFILERANTVEEALHISNGITMEFGVRYGIPKVQYFFADASDRVGIYEQDVYFENVALEVGDYRILTNQSATVDDDMKCNRFKKLKSILDRNDKLDENKAFEVLSQVKESELTAWTTVYDLKKKFFSLCLEQNYGDKFKFDVDKCLRKGAYSIDFAELKLNVKVMKRKRNEGYFPLDTY